jgi:hypothetical protein
MSGKLGFGYIYDFRNPPQWRRRWEDLHAEILDVASWTEDAARARHDDAARVAGREIRRIRAGLRHGSHPGVSVKSCRIR